MNRLLSSTLAGLVLAASSSAFAADLSTRAAMPVPVYTKAPAPAPLYSWTGFYVGGQIGYDYQSASTAYSPDPGSPLFAGDFVPAVTNGTLATSSSQSSGSVIGGVTAGYNFQNGVAVWGIEADFDGLGNQRQSSITPAPATGFPTLATTTSTQTNWLATLRGRLGVTLLPDTLLFGTGGLAVGGVAESTSIIPSGGAAMVSCATNVFCSIGSTTSVRSGWTAGAGIEHMFLQHLTGKIEYLYYDLGNMNYVAAEASASAGAPLGAPNVDVRTSLTGQMVRAGLNYKF